MTQNPSIAVLGLGTMGRALAENFVSKGIPLTVWNRSPEKAEEFTQAHPQAQIRQAHSLAELKEMPRPRALLLMLPAGPDLTSFITELSSILDPADVIIDGANAFFKDSQKHFDLLKGHEIEFLGLGVSGGEEGARKGPSMMAGGSEKAYEIMKTTLELIAARDFQGKPCLAFFGSGGAGHYVKMIHNGIEYAEMQVLAELYDVLNVLGLQPNEIANLFKDWQQRSPFFLLEAAIKVLEKKEGDEFLVNLILDQAEQKGTGRWTAEESLALGIPTPNLTSAVYARGISSFLSFRKHFGSFFKDNTRSVPIKTLKDQETLYESLYAAMMLCRLLNFEQGFALLKAANRAYSFSFDCSEIARVWQGGCILRAELLKPMREALTQETSLLECPFGLELIKKGRPALEQVISFAQSLRIPMHLMGCSLTYLDALSQSRSSAALIQGMRDYFGAHGYERLDQKGSFHSKW